jgi:hypothetical protein
MHLQNGRSAGNGAYVRKGTTSRVMVANRPKVRFWADGSISPKIMDDCLYSPATDLTYRLLPGPRTSWPKGATSLYTHQSSCHSFDTIVGNENHSSHCHLCDWALSWNKKGSWTCRQGGVCILFAFPFKSSIGINFLLSECENWSWKRDWDRSAGYLTKKDRTRRLRCCRLLRVCHA